MNLTRREWLASGAAAAAALTVGVSGRAARAAKPKHGAVFKLSSQLGVIPGKHGSLDELRKKLAMMQAWGFDGVELPGDIVGKEKMFQEAIQDTNLKFSAVCFGSMKGDLVSEDKSKRGPALEKLKQVLTAAGELGTTGVIYVPAFNPETKLTNQEIRQVLLETLPAVGEHALKVKSRLLLEPLNRGEAFFLRQLADAAAICRDVASAGVCMMGDFYHMGIEETSDLGAFISAGDYLRHVHLASLRRVLPGQDERSFVDGFRGLKEIGFTEYCSLECGCDGDPMEEIPKSVAFLNQQWAEA